jgi:hypothetical protein
VASTWRRAGLVAALLWIGLGLALAYAAARVGIPGASGWLAVVAGPVAIAIAGQRARLIATGDWVRAGALAVLIVTFSLMMFSCSSAMMKYG